VVVVAPQVTPVLRALAEEGRLRWEACRFLHAATPMKSATVGASVPSWS
jgi:hypothetical protein